MAEKKVGSKVTADDVDRVKKASAEAFKRLESLPDSDRAFVFKAARDEQGGFEQQRREAQLELWRAQVKNYKQDIKLRKRYADKLFRLLVGWTIGLWGFLLLLGFKILGFWVESPVALAVVINVTVAVIGLFLVVTKNLFPNKGGEDPPQPNPPQLTP